MKMKWIVIVIDDSSVMVKWTNVNNETNIKRTVEFDYVSRMINSPV